MESLRAESTTTALQEAFFDIEHAVSSLYRYFIALQRRPQPNRHLRAAKLDMTFYEELDFQITRIMFPDCLDEVLIDRLAKANTQRRRIFWYRRKHQEKIMNYADRPVLDIPGPNEGTVVGRTAEVKPGPSTSISVERKTFYTKVTERTEATHASTFIERPASPRSESGRTQFTLQSSVAPGKARNRHIPSPPSAEKAFLGVPFLCPFCFSSIELRNGKQDWE
jgi:hypothetical protein